MRTGHHEPGRGGEHDGDADDSRLVRRPAEVPDEDDDADVNDVICTLQKSRLGAPQAKAALQGPNDAAPVHVHEDVEHDDRPNIGDEQSEGRPLAAAAAAEFRWRQRTRLVGGVFVRQQAVS